MMTMIVLRMKMMPIKCNGLVGLKRGQCEQHDVQLWGWHANRAGSNGLFS